MFMPSQRLLLCLFAFLLCLSPFIALAAIKDVPAKTDDLKISGEFADNFGAVLNGAITPMVFTVTNTGSKRYDLNFMSGAFFNPLNSSQVTRQLNPFMYKSSIEPSETKTIPYNLHAVFESQEKFDMLLVLAIQFTDAANKVYKSIAYEGTVAIAEPEISIFDLQVISIYLFVAAVLAGVGYLVKESFSGASTTTKKKTNRPPRSVVEATATEMKLDHDWIPEHHLNSQNKMKKRKA